MLGNTCLSPGPAADYLLQSVIEYFDSSIISYAFTSTNATLTEGC